MRSLPKKEKKDMLFDVFGFSDNGSLPFLSLCLYSLGVAGKAVRYQRNSQR